jgi:hypothetical protein
VGEKKYVVEAHEWHKNHAKPPKWRSSPSQGKSQDHKKHFSSESLTLTVALFESVSDNSQEEQI